MPERPGPWDLLDRPSDPVVADLPEMDARLAYFRSLAETMRTEGDRLHKIASGESLKGKYADELRSSAGDVAKDLDQVVGRYEAVVSAIGEFRPAVDTALRGSSDALDDAIDADNARKAADAMPTATAPQGKQLTPQQEQANNDKTTATNAAADKLEAAKQKLAGVLSALDSAGQTAAATIRKGFNDGLTDSGWDRFKYAFKKFLQILVKVLTYIGMALAVLSLIIPGVGEAIFAASMAIGAVTLAAQLGLKAMGDGSWADIGMSIAGLLSFGAAKVLGPAISAGVKSITGAVKGLGSGAGAAEKAGADAAEEAGNLGKAGGSKGASSGNDETCTNGDPVDVATGDVLTTETDVALPGLLPLVIERTHRSSWRTGRWFGPGWLSTLDQRLEVIAGRVRGAFADGRIVTWTDPAGDDAVVPETGPVWTLRRTSDESYEVHDLRRGLTWRYERRAGYHQRAGYDRETVGADEFPLAAVRDRAGHEVSFSYGASGAPEAVTHSGGYRVDVTVDGGLITALTVAGHDEPLRRYSYDEHSNLTGVVNSSGLPLTFSYDPEGRLTGWEDRNGQFYRYSYNEDGQCVSGEGPGGALSGTFAYEPGVTRWTDFAGAVTTYELTESGRLAALTDPLGGTTRWDRDDRDNVLAVTDPLGRVTGYSYDDAGNVTAAVRPDGARARMEYDERCLPVAVTEADGSRWRQAFDERGNQTRLTAPDGTATLYEYDLAGHLASVTGPGGQTTAVTCDAAGLPVAVTGPDGSVTRYERDQSGQVCRIIGPDGAVTRLTWTSEGQPRTRTLPDGSAESWEWDGEGNLLRQISPGGAVTSHEYGPFDVQVSATGPDGTRSDFAYDHAQRLTTITHAGLTWFYQYDPAGRLTAETDYNGSVTRYGWDAAGQLTSQVNAAGQSLAYAYDRLGNLVSQAADDGSETLFAYDAAGRLVSARNTDATLSFSRDALGRVTTQTCNGRTVLTSYDAAGRVISRITPSGATSEWSFDTAGHPAVLDSGGQQLRFGYGASGLETRRDLPGGAVVAQEWEALGRLAGQTLSGPDPSSVLQRRAYSYGPDGFVTGLEDLLAGGRSLELDSAGRVTAVTGASWSERYSYDRAGNITTATWPSPPSSSAAGWPDGDGRGPRSVSGTLTRQAGNIRYEHDAAGRVVTRIRTRISHEPEIWRYGWDADGRLTSVRLPDGSSWQYSYDPFGRRVAKEHVSASGETLERTLFSWDGLLLAEQDASGEVTTWDYQPGSVAPVAQASSALDRRFFSIVTDLVGAPAELVAPDGTLAGQQRRTVWGGTVWDPAGAAAPLRFPGQYADDETGLHYNNQRYYDPVTGTYLSPDPLGLAPAPNPHAYVANPYAEVDPLGLMPCSNCNSDNHEDAFGAPGQTRTFWANGGGAAGGPARTMRYEAEAWARQNGATTLEMTPCGQFLEKLNAMGMPKSITGPLWINASRQIARGASGTAHGFQPPAGPRLGSVWPKYEKPELMANEKVNQIAYHIGGPTPNDPHTVNTVNIPR